MVERAPELRTGGYKIDLRGAAIEVADRIAKSRFQSWMGVQIMRMLKAVPFRNAMIEKMIGPIAEAANAIELVDHAPSRA